MDKKKTAAALARRPKAARPVADLKLAAMADQPVPRGASRVAETQAAMPEPEAFLLDLPPGAGFRHAEYRLDLHGGIIR